MKRLSIYMLSAWLGVSFSVLLFKLFTYVIDVYPKYYILKNAILINHHDFGGTHLTTYIYVDSDGVSQNPSCLKDVKAMIYRGDLYIFKPHYIRFYYPQNIGLIGKVDTCKISNVTKEISITWEGEGITFKVGDDVFFTKI